MLRSNSISFIAVIIYNRIHLKFLLQHVLLVCASQVKHWWTGNRICDRKLNCIWRAVLTQAKRHGTCTRDIVSCCRYEGKFWWLFCEFPPGSAVHIYIYNYWRDVLSILDCNFISVRIYLRSYFNLYKVMSCLVIRVSAFPLLFKGNKTIDLCQGIENVAGNTIIVQRMVDLLKLYLLVLSTFENWNVCVLFSL